MRKAILIFIMLCLPLGAMAQAYFGEHKYDGVHKNEAMGYLQGGYNSVTHFYMGPALFYKRHLTDRWSVEGAAQAQFGKQLYSFYGKGGYRLPWKVFNSDFYFDGKIMYSRYNQFNTNEFVANVSATWETPYFMLRLGGSYIHYQLLGTGYSEPITLTFGIGTNIRPRTNPWNIGIFFRNYDDFYYENWNINWGLNFYATLPWKLKLFGEFNVRPAGSMSQLASRYETSGKLGVKYVW